MALATGTRLGPYEILALIGAGGMGEVYRARDTRLDRDVAVKILPEGFTADADRVARFQREAKVLASLSHPNIAIIHGLEHTDGAYALVMELVEGDDLAQRIARGPVPLADALLIAKQIAEALEAAHEHGVVHRDLKPANIKVRPDGTVKVLDFGLAKAFNPTASGPNNLANSPTLSMQATQAGVILGTAAYMSPEQAAGKPVDKRSDLWAFGVVLMEVLTGRPVFTGETVSHVLAAVLTKDPDWTTLPADTPLAIRKLLRRCVEKDRKRRLASAADAGLEIDDAQLSGTLDVSSAAGPVVPRPWSRFVWVATGVIVGGLLMAPLAVSHLREQPRVAPEVIRFQIAMPEKVSPALAGGFSVSPDGRYLAFPATGMNGITSLWVRELDSLEARSLPGTEGNNGAPPIWSPDSRSLAFDAGSTLKRIDIAGGAALTLCAVPSMVVGGSWNRDSIIIFALNNGPIMRVSAAGGPATPLTMLDASRQEITHLFPSFLPDGRHFLYLRLSSGETSGTYVGALDVTPNEQNAKRLVATPFESAYIPSRGSGSGHLLFRRERTLLAQPFDPRALELVGEPVPMAERLRDFLALGSFSASAAGVLVYRTGADEAISSLTWFDRTGATHGTVGDPSDIRSVALSPDGARGAVSRGSGVMTDVWLLDFAPGTSTRFTFGGGLSGSPVWSPDGSHIVFRSARDGPYNLYRKPVNGATNDAALLTSGDDKMATGWSRDGRFLLFTVLDSKTKTKGDVWLFPFDGERTPLPYLRTQFNEDQGHFSPDGHWVAYRSDESGRSEVYVRAFSPSAPGAKVLVSRSGGSDPRWRRDGKELFYLASDGTLMAVDVTAGTDFTVGSAKPLFKLPALTIMRASALAPGVAFWDVAPDGTRFLVPVPVEERTGPSFTVVLHWNEELKARVPTK